MIEVLLGDTASLILSNINNFNRMPCLPTNTIFEIQAHVSRTSHTSLIDVMHSMALDKQVIKTYQHHIYSHLRGTLYTQH